MMYHPVKSGCRRNQQFSRYGRKSHIWLYGALTVTLTLRAKQSCRMTHGPIILHRHDEFGTKRFSNSDDIIWTNAETLNLCCDLDLQHRYPIFWQNIPVNDDTLSNYVWLLKYQQFKQNSRKAYFLLIWAFTVTLTLKTANQSFCMTLQVMKMHHYTKFGYKRFKGSQNISWTNTKILNLNCDLDLEHSNQIFS